MRIITQREIIKGVLKSWKKQYPYERGQGWNDDKTERLSKLNFSRVSAKKVDDIIGNCTWTHLPCDECGEHKKIVIRFLEKYEEEYECNSADICEDCLKKALRKIKQEGKKK